MAHSLFRFTESLYNVPHLIRAEAAHSILQYLSHRNSVEFSSTIVSGSQEAVKPNKLDKIGEIQIDGALSYKPVVGACGEVQGCSYQGILEQAQMLIDDGCTTLITVHSSPGGQASHVFSTANDLRALCDENNVQWFAYIDTVSASASLALQCAADEVIIHPDAETGSVGCVVALMDRSKAMEMAGYKPIYISSTPGKTPFAEDGSFSKDFLDEIQNDVTRLGNLFADHVSKYTGINSEEILAWDAKMFHAEEALQAGLVNQVMDHKQFSAYIADKHKGKA